LSKIRENNEEGGAQSNRTRLGREGIPALLIEVQDSLDGPKEEDGRDGLSEKEKLSNVNDACDLSGCGIGKWFVSPRWLYRPGELTFGLKTF
jgi:hypothetical protein